METCTKCGWKLPAHAEVCPYCGQPVESDEEKKRLKLRLPTEAMPPLISRLAPAKVALGTQARGRTILILALVVLSGLLIASLAFALVQWSASTSASPKLGVSPG